MNDEHEVKALLQSIATRQIREYALGAQRDKDMVCIKTDVHRLAASHESLKTRVDRIDATATGARQSVSDAESSHAIESQALQNHIATLETKLDAVGLQAVKASKDMGQGAQALTLGGTKQQQATRTSILVAVLFALGQLIQLWRAH